MQRDRHARHRRHRPDRRRHPWSGYRTRSLAAFERLVGNELDALPRQLSEPLDNVQITVEETPADLGLDEILLGLYEGVPQTERALAGPALPDRITVFRRPHELRAGSAPQLAALVRETLVHEIAHHLGIEDDRLDELGWD